MKIILIGLLGCAGVFCRYGIDQYSKRQPEDFPWAILAINVLGSFLAGAIVFWADEHQRLSSDVKDALLIGFCGGLTTFSAFSLQSVQLWQQSQSLKAAMYLVVSPVSGVLAVLVALAAFRNSH